jgi:predicted ABC-type transport system involved in lysophospholipase L1 biosynthesis ATPase subunit
MEPQYEDKGGAAVKTIALMMAMVCLGLASHVSGAENLADEPTGNLDTENTKAISGLFLSLAERYGKTVIMASHDPKAVEQFKKVYNMRDGNFV